MDAAEIAQDGDAGDVLAVEGEHARRLLAEAGGALWGRDLAV